MDRQLPRQPTDGTALLNSELDAPLASIFTSVDHLHSALDEFISGKRRELKAQRTRDSIHDSLNDIDGQLKEIDRLRSAQAKPFEAVVTPSLVRGLSKAGDELAGLRAVLYPIVSQRGKHKISAGEHSRIFGYLDLLGDGLEELQKMVS